MNGVMTADNCVAATEVIGWRSVCACAHTHVINVITDQISIVAQEMLFPADHHCFGWSASRAHDLLSQHIIVTSDRGQGSCECPYDCR